LSISIIAKPNRNLIREILLPSIHSRKRKVNICESKHIISRRKHIISSRKPCISKRKHIVSSRKPHTSKSCHSEIKKIKQLQKPLNDHNKKLSTMGVSLFFGVIRLATNYRIINLPFPRDCYADRFLAMAQRGTIDSYGLAESFRVSAFSSFP